MINWLIGLLIMLFVIFVGSCIYITGEGEGWW